MSDMKTAIGEAIVRISQQDALIRQLRTENVAVVSENGMLHRTNENLQEQVKVLEAWQRGSISSTIALVNIAEVIANERGVVSVEEAVAALVLFQGEASEQ